MKNPPPIYINGLPWRIEYFSEEEVLHEEALARCYKDSRLIKITPEMGGETLTDSLFHEVIHCIFHSMHMDRLKLDEETIACFIGTGLNSIFMDSRNKKVVQYFTDKLNV